MIDWLADTSRAPAVAAWGFLIGTLGLVPTLVGLYLTYVQARNAKISADEVRKEVEQFGLRRDKSEAIGCLGEAKAAIEVAGILINSKEWRQASSIYDDARKSIQKSRSICNDLSPPSSKKLRLIVEHLAAFSNQVDNALDGKESYPDGSAVRAAIRKNSDDLTVIQRELHEGIS